MLEPTAAPPQLKRSLNLLLMTLYGLGTTIGAGIFVLIGEVAGVAGMRAPWSFIVAAVLAAFTALSFAELCARLPKSAGEAVYVYEGLRSKTLSIVVGLLVAAAGIISSAAIASGSVGYLREFADVPPAVLICLVVLVIAAVAAWGIGQSVVLASLMTLVEVGAIVVVIWSGWDLFSQIGPRWAEMAPTFETSALVGVLSGSLLAFYAFIGFEDMVNVAEEVKSPQKTMPAAIILTLLITTLLYAGVSLVAVLAVPAQDLAASGAPLALIFRETSGGAPTAIAMAGIFAVLNGALIQVIMASRVLYGMANQGWAPKRLARVDRRTHTPVTATALVSGIVLILALFIPLVTLARITSTTVLVTFALVNLALWRLKRAAPADPGILTLPRWIPAIGFAISALFATLQIAEFVDSAL